MNTLRSYHFWLVAAALVLGGLAHYAEELGIPYTVPPSFHFGLTRHSLDRLLFLLPITYCAFIFGLVPGLAANLTALAIMLPRAVFISPAPLDALMETGLVMIQGALVSLWFGTRTTEQKNYRTALSELQRAHQLLQDYLHAATASEKRLTTLNAISTVLTQSIELDEVLRKAVGLVTELMDVEVSLIFSLEEGSPEMVLIAHEGVSERFAQVANRMKLEGTFNAKVVESGHPMVVKDAAADPMMNNPELKKMRIQNEVIVPLMFKNQVTGTLCIGMRRPREFRLEEIELLTAIGRQIGTAIENARLYEKERLAACRAAVSERNYRQLFENANDAIWIHDMDGNITVANRAAAVMTGYTTDELAGMNAADFLSEDSLRLAREVRYKLQHGGAIRQPYEQRLIRKDESEAILMLASSLVTEDEEPTGFLHIARDMTQERRLQDNLRYYLTQITNAQEEERKRIAHELHDDTIQVFFGLSRQVDNYLRNSLHLTPADVAFLRDLRRQSNAAMDGVRRFSQDLRPPMLDDLGLLASVRWLVSDLKGRSCIIIDLKVDGAERRLSREKELALYRVIQEALRNVEKHAYASQVEVVLEFSEFGVRACVSDNGRGFDASAGVGDMLRGGKLGLAGIEERVRLLDGKLKLQSEPGKGTVVEVEAPG